MSNKNSIYLCILILFYIIVRLLLIFYSPFVYLNEEIKQISLPIDILRGKLSIPYWCYMDSPHSGGSLFTQITLLPFMIFFGKYYLALKIAALTYSVLTFLLIILLLRKYYSLENIFFPLFLLFVFSTPHYLQKSLLLTGNTVELIFFIFLFIYLTDRYLIEGKSDKYSYFLLGLIAGLGCWVQYVFSLFVLSFLLCWIRNQGLKIFKSSFWHFLAGIILGFSPWIIYNSIYGFPSIYADVRVTPLLLSGDSFDFKISVLNFENFIVKDLPRGFHFLDLGPIPAKYIAYFFYFLFWGVYIVMIFKKNISPEERKFRCYILSMFGLILLFHPMLHFPVGLSGEVWSRLNPHREFYILYLQPLMFMILTMGYAILNKNPHRNFFRWLLLFLLPILLLQYGLLLNFKKFNNKKLFISLQKHKAYSNIYEGGYNFLLDPYIWRKVLDNIGEEYREHYLKGSADCWNDNRDNFRPWGYLYFQLGLLSDEERQIFLHYLNKDIKQSLGL